MTKAIVNQLSFYYERMTSNINKGDIIRIELDGVIRFYKIKEITNREQNQSTPLELEEVPKA